MASTLPDAISAPSGLLAAGFDFVGILLVILAASALFDWLKKQAQKGSTDTFDPDLFRPEQPKPPAQPSRPLSTWEEEIRKMLEAESAPTPPPPPPLPTAPVRRSPPPVPVYECDPLVNETEGRAAEPVPTYLSSMERPHAAFDRGSHIGDRVRARLADVSDHSDADAAFVRAGQIDDRVASRMAAAGNLQGSGVASTNNAVRTASRAEMKALVDALRSPAHAKGAIIASVILGPPKAFER